MTLGEHAHPDGTKNLRPTLVFGFRLAGFPVRIERLRVGDVNEFIIRRFARATRRLACQEAGRERPVGPLSSWPTIRIYAGHLAAVFRGGFYVSLIDLPHRSV